MQSIIVVSDILSRLDVEPLEMLENGVSYSYQQKQFWLHVVNLKKVCFRMIMSLRAGLDKKRNKIVREYTTFWLRLIHKDLR